MINKNRERGIIVSVQGLDNETSQGIAMEAIKGGAVAIRTDKFLECGGIPLIGLCKRKVKHPVEESYITDSVDAIKRAMTWADFIAIDYRKCNKRLVEINKFVNDNGIRVIADIGDVEDYENIIENDWKPEYIATTFRIFHRPHYFDFDFLDQLNELGCYNIIAEGNVKTRETVRRLIRIGVDYICIGKAISAPYELTKKFTSVYKNLEEENGRE